ncbi:hypothetical protein ACFL17_01945 [Pseudomonadota bacterium]
MKIPSFLEGATVALIASLVGSVGFVALTTVYAGGTASRLIVAGLALAYIFYLLSRSHERIGRLTILIAWLALAVAIWLLSPSLSLYLLAHVGLIWLIRSLYFYSSLLPAFIDLSLNGLSLAAAFWAISQSNSLFLSIWCFFLTQALFVSIPNHLGKENSATRLNRPQDDYFEQAHQVAEAALRKFTSLN